MRTHWLFATLPLGLTAACSQRVDVLAEQAALRQADSAYSAAVRAKDLDALVRLYATDAVMYPNNDPTVSGIDGVRQYADALFKTPGLTVAFTPITIQVADAGAMGFTVNDARTTTTDAKGTASTERIRDIHLWKKGTDGRWRIAVDVWNSPPPPASTSSATASRR